MREKIINWGKETITFYIFVIYIIIFIRKIAIEKLEEFSILISEFHVKNAGNQTLFANHEQTNKCHDELTVNAEMEQNVVLHTSSLEATYLIYQQSQ